MVFEELPEATKPVDNLPVGPRRRQVDEQQVVCASEVEEALAKSQAPSASLIRFSPLLEQHYIESTAERRVRLVRRRGFVVMFVFIGMLLSDWFMVPDRIPVAIFVRTVVFVPVYLLTLYSFTRLSKSSASNWILTASAGLTALLNLYIIVPSTSPLACGYLATMALMVVCWNSLLRYGLTPALVHCALVAMQFGLAILVMPSHGGLLAVPVSVMLIGSIAFSLYGCYSLERAERAAYLLRTRNGIIHTKLKVANDRLYQQARQDPLTGVPNRRYFDEAIAKVCLPDLQQALGRHSEVGVMLIDVDFFKLYNDHYGHSAGDRCLKSVAQAIEKCVRQPADLFARIGGEEFAVILQQTNGKRAIEVSERILSAVNSLPLRHGARQDGTANVTISIGLAVGRPTDKQSVQALVSEADVALLRAKAAGRNRIVRGGSAC